MANHAGAICRVLLDGKEIALIRPQPSHANDSIQRMLDQLTGEPS